MALSFMPCTTNLLRVEGFWCIFCYPVIAFGVYQGVLSYHWIEGRDGVLLEPNEMLWVELGSTINV